MHPISRRDLLLGAGTVALTAGCTVSASSTVDPHGRTQAGITRPASPQRHCAVSVLDLPADTALAPILAGLGAAITGLARNPVLAGLPAADLTATVGLGPRLAPPVAELPEFPGDEVSPNDRGGDLLLQVCGGDPLTVSAASGELARLLRATARWSQNAFLGPSEPDGKSRNILSFVDGIAGPKGDIELNQEVWREDGGTIAVVRRMRLKVGDFVALPVATQERVFGRRKDNSTPLSGGTDIDLAAKTPDGQYLIPADAHIRLAHPLPAGVGMMLRRSYNFDNGPGDRGLLFISFQRELRTFVNTAYRMIEGGDALLRYATTTASAAFYILPGFTPAAALHA